MIPNKSAMNQTNQRVFTWSYPFHPPTPQGNWLNPGTVESSGKSCPRRSGDTMEASGEAQPSSFCRSQSSKTCSCHGSFPMGEATRIGSKFPCQKMEVS